MGKIGDRVKAFVEKNPGVTLEEIADGLSLSIPKISGSLSWIIDWRVDVKPPEEYHHSQKVYVSSCISKQEFIDMHTRGPAPPAYKSVGLSIYSNRYYTADDLYQHLTAKENTMKPTQTLYNYIEANPNCTWDQIIQNVPLSPGQCRGAMAQLMSGLEVNHKEKDGTLSTRTLAVTKRDDAYSVVPTEPAPKLTEDKRAGWKNIADQDQSVTIAQIRARKKLAEDAKVALANERAKLLAKEQNLNRQCQDYDIALRVLAEISSENKTKAG